MRDDYVPIVNFGQSEATINGIGHVPNANAHLGLQRSETHIETGMNLNNTENYLEEHMKQSRKQTIYPEMSQIM